MWHDWLAGSGGAPHWPMPWSADGSTSFLVDPQRWRTLLGQAGLEVTRYEDLTTRTDGWYADLERGLTRARERATAAGRSMPPHLGRLAQEVSSLRRNLREGRVVAFFGEARSA